MSNFFFGIIVKFFKQSAAVSLRLIIITRLNNGIKLVHIADKHGFRRFLFFKFGKQFRQLGVVQFFNQPPHCIGFQFMFFLWSDPAAGGKIADIDLR